MNWWIKIQLMFCKEYIAVDLIDGKTSTLVTKMLRGKVYIIRFTQGGKKMKPPQDRDCNKIPKSKTNKQWRELVAHHSGVNETNAKWRRWFIRRIGNLRVDMLGIYVIKSDVDKLLKEIKKYNYKEKK